jgi:hypothetical protein
MYGTLEGPKSVKIVINTYKTLIFFNASSLFKEITKLLMKIFAGLILTKKKSKY